MSTGNLFVLGVWTLAIASTLQVARRHLGMPPFAPALRRMTEVVGATVLCCALNLALGALLVLVARALGIMVSVYFVADPTLLVLSLLEAVVLLAWADAPS